VPLTLAEINAASDDAFVALLEGTYEHSPWIAREAGGHRPFASRGASASSG
jgi:N-carbamoyl-L-amino-acid hydrolase